MSNNNTTIKKKTKLKFFRKYHKWIGLFFSFFILMFSISGIILNHRTAITEFQISRSYLTSKYEYKNWNNAAIKSSCKIDKNQILLFGGAGIYLCDTTYKNIQFFTDGLQKGADNRIISNIVISLDKNIFASTNFDLYRLNKKDKIWERQDFRPRNRHDRLTDLAIRGDSLIVLTRSHIYYSLAPYTDFTEIKLKADKDYDGKVSVFKTIWLLHSGELFGSIGVIIVDCLSIILTLMIISGIIILISPKIIRKRKNKSLNLNKQKQRLKFSIKWHNKLGSYCIILLLLIGISGIFLRPPFLIAIIRSRIPVIPFTSIDSKNPWYDSLRTIRYDTHKNEWILYSSRGFFSLSDIRSTPIKLKNPPITSVMGTSVFEQIDTTTWIVGSFNGLYYWDSETGNNYDYFTNDHITNTKPKAPDVEKAVSGFISDYNKEDVVFAYIQGAITKKSVQDFPEMPKEYKRLPISLWQTALEVHTGRIYFPTFGLISELFIFFAGLIYIFILISGYLVYRRFYKRK